MPIHMTHIHKLYIYILLVKKVNIIILLLSFKKRTVQLYCNRKTNYIYHLRGKYNVQSSIYPKHLPSSNRQLANICDYYIQKTIITSCDVVKPLLCPVRAMAFEVELFTIYSMIRGCHTCLQECLHEFYWIAKYYTVTTMLLHNHHSPFAVVVYKWMTVVGHMPRRVCYVFW